MAKIDGILERMEDMGASDLHLTVGSRPIIRQHGDLVRLKSRELTQKDMEALFLEIMDDDQIAEYEETSDVDFAYEVPGVSRFRVNVFAQRKGMGAVLRTIPTEVLSADDIGLPDVVRRFCKLSKGLVLVTGPTGSGKSTTLAAMVDLINETRPDHILTVEDPIEFTHVNKKALVNQREVGTHTNSFATALKAALREDPDVILLGEMRDLETISLGITAAETGHLVFGTLHTNSAAKTVDRIIDAFPADQQEQIRSMLGDTLKGVVAQDLLRTADGSGRVAAQEILVVNSAVANQIREGKTHQIPSAIQTGGKEGMVLMDQALMTLLEGGKITAEQAYAKAHNKDDFVSHLDEAPEADAMVGA